VWQAGGDPEWLQWAYQLQDVQDQLFWDDIGSAAIRSLIFNDVFRATRRSCKMLSASRMTLKIGCTTLARAAVGLTAGCDGLLDERATPP